MIGTGAGIDQRIDIGMIAAIAILTVEVAALFGHRVCFRTNMDAGIAVDALVLQRSMIEAGLVAEALHLAIEMLAPGVTQIFRGHARRHAPAVLLCLLDVLGAGCGAEHLLAGVHVGVTQDQMAMGIVLVLALVVKCREPGNAVLPDLAHEALDHVVTLLLREFKRQSDDEGVGNAGVLDYTFLVRVPIEIRPRRAALGRHVVAGDMAAGLGALDVIDEIVGRTALMRGLADGVMGEVRQRTRTHGTRLSRRLDARRR